MPQTVLITGTGRSYALGFNLVKRYLEHGDTVFASIRRPSEILIRSVSPLINCQKLTALRPVSGIFSGRHTLEQTVNGHPKTLC